MEVETPPPRPAPAAGVRGLKCRGGGGGAEPAMGTPRAAETPHRGQEPGEEDGSVVGVYTSAYWIVRSSKSGQQPQSSCGGGGEHLSTSLMEHDKLHGERCHARQSLSPASYTSSIGAATINLVSPTRSLDCRTRFREAGCQLKTSTELLKVLNRIWSLEEQHAADVLAMKGLKSELQHAHVKVQELMQERQRHHYEIDSLVRQVSEDKMARKSKDQEKVKAALRSLQEELEDERHLRKHSESLHRKLKKELSEMKSAFLKTVRDLEKQKKTTHLLENLCDEFALGIRNYEEEVRVLKQKHVKQYEHKFDKSVVHISEAWLDERMQMQNADPREALAERISITERLNSEIQTFLNASRSSKGDKLYIRNEKQDASLCRQSLESVHLNGATSAPQLAEDDDDNSIASDLHCFELSMHGNTIQNHDLAGTRHKVTGCMYSPMRRLEFSNGVCIEGSRISITSPCSKKEKIRPNGTREQVIASTPEISPCNDAKNAPRGVQDETVMTQVSQRLHDDLLKIKSEAPQHAYLGQKSNDHQTKTAQLRNDQCTASGNVYDLRSPVHHLNNQRSSLDHEISEASPAHPLEAKGSTTLKAKLLQARLEGQHARMRASGYTLTSTRRK
uniref:Intracellular protein transport protein USO1-like n=1 Tax=Oryza brachyantha TaxID=4533 RepID=J3MEJ5_ORYBR